jgi:hypothetical protein
MGTCRPLLSARVLTASGTPIKRNADERPAIGQNSDERPAIGQNSDERSAMGRNSDEAEEAVGRCSLR